MNPLSVALQGIGFGSKLTALQGFGLDEQLVEDNDNLIVRPVLRKKRKVEEPRRDTDDDAIFLFLLN